MSRYQMPSAGVLALALSAALASGAQAQGGLSAQTAVTLNATNEEALSISATPGVVNFDLLNNPAAGDAPITFEVRASVSQARTSLLLELYFADRDAALNNSAANIPSTAVKTDLLGPTFPCDNTPTVPVIGSCGIVELNSNPGVSIPSGFVATRVVNLFISGVSVPAGTYTGTLFAQVTAL